VEEVEGGDEEVGKVVTVTAVGDMAGGMTLDVMTIVAGTMVINDSHVNHVRDHHHQKPGISLHRGDIVAKEAVPAAQ